MIIKHQKEDLLTYLEDTSNIKGNAIALYIPDNIDELRAVVGKCAGEKIPLTVAAGRTGTTAGCVPSQGIIISLERFNKILAIDAAQNTYVQSGVTLEALDQEAARFNLKFCAASTEPLAFIGGAVSTNASGVRGFGYGSTRNYVVGLEILLTNGKLLVIERGQITAKSRHFDFTLAGQKFVFDLPAYNMPQVKHQAGYFVKDDMDLIDLFIGSEGTLGIITACRIKLQQIPGGVLDGLLFFESETAALNFAEAIKLLKHAGEFKPTSLEFFDAHALNFLKPYYTFIPQKGQAAIYFEHEAKDAGALDLLQDQWAKLAGDAGVMLDPSIFATNSGERKRIFDFRHRLPQAIGEFLRQVNQVKTAGDIAVPGNKFREMYDFYQATARKLPIPYVVFGHIGESHLHFNFLPQNDAQAAQSRQTLEIFCRKAVALGGTISAEHGIGKIKKPYLEILYGKKYLLQMANIKKYFDPACILGLDNIFAKELLGS